MAWLTKKRSLDTFLRDGQDHEIPAKPSHCSESLSSRITDWLNQLPPEDPDSTYTGPEPALGSPAPTTASVPASLSSRAYTETIPSSASSGRLVEVPDYRSNNLEGNNIYYLGRDELLPQRISSICDSIAGRRSSPEPTPEEAGKEMAYLRHCQDEGARAPDLKHFLYGKVLPSWDDIGEFGLMMHIPDKFKRECVPGPSTGIHKVSRPRPTLTYGYSSHGRDGPFSTAQRHAAMKMRPRWGNIDIWPYFGFPFLIAEIYAEGPQSDSLWTVTNRCLGGSASCVKVVGRLNGLLQQYPDPPYVNEATFSVVMNQETARLYVTWKSDDGLEYHMRRVARFDLEHPEGFVWLRRYVRNIIDWGKGPRLREIQEALSFVHEEDQRIVASPETCTIPVPADNRSGASGNDSQPVSDPPSSVVSGSGISEMLYCQWSPLVGTE